MATSSNKLDVIEHVLSGRTEDMKYMLASNVNASSFVSVKLSGSSNYQIWKAQMLCLIKSQVLLHIIDVEHPFPGDKGLHMIKRYDELVKGWIFGSLKEKVLKDFVHFDSAREVWMELESSFNSPKSDSDSDREGDSTNANISSRKQDLKYMQASNVNVSNFVPEKLSGQSNYPIWKAQIMCLIESQKLLHIIDVPQQPDNLTDKYDNLVKGWIFGTMNNQVFKRFSSNRFVHDLWSELESTFNPPRRDREEFKFGIEVLRDAPEIENTDNNIRRERLYNAAVEGCWWKAKSILKIHKNAATEAITPNGNTILHIAVEIGHNYFVEKLLEFIKDGKDIETKNDKGRTALHIAALVGNEYAAQLLVQKRKELLLIQDYDRQSPLSFCYTNVKHDITPYLMKCALSSELSPVTNKDDAIMAAIFKKQYDLARILIEKYRDKYHEIDWTLMLYSLTISFPSDLGFMESFIYPSFSNVRQKIAMRGSSIFHSNYMDKCVDDILRVVKICNDTCCSWNISMILVGEPSITCMGCVYEKTISN